MEQDDSYIYQVLKNEADGENLNTDYLKVMINQYFLADKDERENDKEDWVNRVLKRISNDYFPNGEGTKIEIKKLTIEKMGQKEKNELRVFEKFAEICPLKIDADSIEIRKPPEPDIFCKLHDGNPIAFEIVQCIDEDIAHNVYDTLIQKSALDVEFEKLQSQQKQEIEAKLSDAYIGVDFYKSISKNVRQSAIPIIFEFLLTLKDQVNGEISFKQHPELKGIVQHIIISRGFDNGPLFGIEPSPIWFSNPIVNQVKTKFNKKYESIYIIELLCYYELQPELPENRWLPQLEAFVSKQIRRSPFSRIWVYSVIQNRIIYVYP